VLAACEEPEAESTPRVLTDQAGGEFFWGCNKNGLKCEVHRIAGVSPPLPECEAGIGYYRGSGRRFFSVTAVCPRGPDDFERRDIDRFLTCETDDACPTIAEAGKMWECRAGLCQLHSQTGLSAGMPTVGELETLCIGPVPHFADWRPRYDELLPRIEAACPGDHYQAPCISIPEGCADPR
jgi:hypothetical protein